MYAMGLVKEEINKPLIGVVNPANELIPGHVHLHQVTKAVKEGIRLAGGVPLEFPTIGVCDGIAMNHEGMKMSLPSRELIADSIEIMATAHPFDGLVCVTNCDKIVRYAHGNAAAQYPKSDYKWRPNASWETKQKVH